MVLIAQLHQETEVSGLTDDCDRFCRYVRRMVGAVVTVGIGQVCANILSLAQSYGSAREAVSYRAIFGACRAINHNEIVPQEAGNAGPVDDTALTELFKMVRLGSTEDVTAAVDRYLHQTFVSQTSLQQHHICIMELISAYYRFSVNHDIADGDFTGDIKNLYGSLLDMEPDVLRGWLVSTSLAFREKLICARSRSTQSFVAKAQEYVHNNYADEQLSLDCICAFLGVSNSYFSTVFKKETGHSFISYLTDYRMDQAAALLIGTTEKSYRIANKVGYTDPNYFSYVFKRRFGVSPSKYRTEHTESKR